MSCGGGIRINIEGTPVFQKAPGSNLDFGINSRVDGWLEPTETIISASWAQSHVSGASALTLVPSDHDNGIAVVWIDGGDAEADYRVTGSIVTSAGREDSRSFILQIRAR